jgi:uncharacterized repeat protein (TIGR03803 family)
MKHRRLVNFGAALAAGAMSLIFATTASAGPKYKVLHAFGKGRDGGGVWGSVAFDSKGNLYGTTSGGGAKGYGTVFKLARHANGQWAESVLHSFGKNDPGGCEPFGGPALDAAGNVYGTTQLCGLHHAGVAFELTPQADGWRETVLHNFCSQSGCKDGSVPWAGLTWDGSGNFYGTAFAVFELSQAGSGWKEKVLYRFCSKTNCSDGDAPYAGVILDAVGNLYGTTNAGGAYKAGTVYQVRQTPGGWKEQVLHSFPSFPKDGQVPGLGQLVLDDAGNLDGTTSQGGTNFCFAGCGTIFRLTRGTDGRWKETILYNFENGASGFSPGGGVVLDKAGILYGTTTYGGSSSCDCGVVYKLSPEAKGKWTYTVLHRFSGVDGAAPDANLILDSKGNLYGTTASGGTSGAGVVFELTP